LSGLNGLLPFIIRLTITNVVSEISINDTITGKAKSNELDVSDLKIIGKAAIAKPRNMEPPSPRNIFAGARLYTKNPIIENINTIVRTNGKFSPNLW
jgi:hypothetical protein